MVVTNPTDGITMTAVFVPQSKSRNAKEKNLSLNWLVTITANGRSITTDYMQGIGHLPGYKHGWKSIDDANREKEAAETGKYLRPNAEYFRTAIPPPTLDDVLSCLILDASAIDAGSFEDWAQEFGYDTDSRAAEKIYDACVKTALQLRSMLGNDRIELLRTHYQDR